MSLLHELPAAAIEFYATSPYRCSYLPDKTARSQVAAPPELIDTELYGLLVRLGFRRSGEFVYRPWCDACHACLPVRVRVADFVPARRHRRALKRHASLRTIEGPPRFHEEHYALYCRYQSQRHAGSGMDRDSREQYSQFLLASRFDSRLVEFRDGETLRMVCLIDVLADGLSAVYTYYDPTPTHASYGSYAILWQIAQCQSFGLPYLYLGYWVAECRKMAYKATFQPLEVYCDARWQSFDALFGR